MAANYHDQCGGLQRDLCSGEVREIGREKGGLYIVKKDPNKKLQLSVMNVVVSQDKEDNILWHMRLGHALISTMKNMKSLQNKLSNANGPYKISTHDKKQFFLTIVDDMSRFTWIYLLKFKSDVFVVLKVFLVMIRTQFNAITKIIRTDNGGKSPFELLYAKPTVVEHLKVFGCLCYAVNLPKGDKFIARAKAVVFLGYSVTQKGYKLLDLETKQLFVSRDVVFKEHIFPFQQTAKFSYPSSIGYSSTAHDMERLQDHEVVDYEVYEEAYSVDTHERSENSVDGEADATHDEPIDDIVNNNSEPAEDTHAMTKGEAALPPTLTDTPTNITEGIIETGHTIPTLRKLARISKTPLWLQDFVTSKKDNGATLHTLADCICYDHVSKKYKRYLTKQSTLTEPQSFKEASQDDDWINAMKLEIRH
uniref:Retroviral polymerase SH3-like domain-containing protein n=2 Tax=Nicotiana TaxID=4085 RepID=A0A1S3XZ93_TOBAC|nr:PREDICTED: uncharacterized protein LOC104210944 [Nicotiana sylvestris]XP_016445225.1 PREDICTED: uncharacterized protein LOC107770429 [Nicotiana tabacum]